jgi:hypothetical protein
MTPMAFAPRFMRRNDDFLGAGRQSDQLPMKRRQQVQIFPLAVGAIDHGHPDRQQEHK